MAIELIPTVIATVVRPYMQEQNLNEDKMLFQYIGVKFMIVSRVLGVDIHVCAGLAWKLLYSS